MNSETVICLGDFAENYKYVIQDEIQSFHWSNDQCTLHPLILYNKSNEELEQNAYCIVSNDNEHDVNMVYEIQKRITNDIKKKTIKYKKY